MALRGVDLEVRIGELLMLVGPSGCGKTTLISVMAGILDHDEGECLVFSKDLRGMGQRRKTQYRGWKIGFVFQAYNLLLTLSAVENVSVPLLINGSARSQAQETAGRLLDRVGLGDRLHSLPSQLSGGAATASGHCAGPWPTARSSLYAMNPRAPSMRTPAAWSWKSFAELPFPPIAL